MNTLTIPDLSEELHRRLEERAKANHRSIEEEALYCLRAVVETDEGALHEISAGKWEEIERSVCETIHDKGTPLTDSDFERYREMTRGRTGQ